jgi:hypothetical protein
VNPDNQMLETLGAEWANLRHALGELSVEQWTAPTSLEPVDPDASCWTVAELAAHLAIGANMVTNFLQGAEHGEPTRDRAGFFVVARADVAPVVYRLARESTGYTATT